MNSDRTDPSERGGLPKRPPRPDGGPADAKDADQGARGHAAEAGEGSSQPGEGAEASERSLGGSAFGPAGNVAESDPDAETAPDASGFSAVVEALRKGSGEALPERIGEYLIAEQVGRGGMGSVLLARRESDRFRRPVAIKLMRRGMDTEEMLARFDLERQLLSALDHPNIARVFGAGRTEDGRPYFVMEYVKGVPIDRYCDDRNLSVERRLRLFQKVCGAVNYAHQNLIVHRDIKPSNILVTADGEPKLLDFGIAKLLQPERVGLAALTRPEQRLLTYEYASPEQVSGEAISTSSDVYSLGVLLYELLTGHRPYQLSRRLHDEAVRVICHHEPERPSTAVGRPATVKDAGGSVVTLTSDEIARRRKAAPTRLKRSLSGDLDNIILKALRKNPTRRYPSPTHLADDLARHLDGQTVTARPLTRAYRIAKFVQRNRAGVAAAAAIALSLTGGLAVAAWQWGEAEAQRAVAESRYEQLRRATSLLDDVERELETREGATPLRGSVLRASVRLFDGLAEESGEDPELARELARQYRRYGRLAFHSEGLLNGAIDAYERARALQAEAGGVPAEERAGLAIDLMLAYNRASEFDASENLAEQAERTIGAMISADRDLLAGRLAGARAEMLLLRGERDEARAAFETAVERLRNAHADRPDGTEEAAALALQLVGLADWHNGARASREEALPLLAESRRIAEQGLGNDPENRVLRRLLLLAYERLSHVMLRLGRPGAAQDALREATRLAEVGVENNPFSGTAFRDLARIHELAFDVAWREQDWNAAHAYAAAFEAMAASAAEADPLDTFKRWSLGLAQEKLGNASRRLGDNAAALKAMRGARATFERVLAIDDRHALARAGLMRAWYSLGQLAWAEEQREAARDAFVRATEVGDSLRAEGSLADADVPYLGAAWATLGQSIRLGDARKTEDPTLAQAALEAMLRGNELLPNRSPARMAAEAEARLLLGEHAAALQLIDAAQGRLLPEGASPADLEGRSRWLLDKLTELRTRATAAGDGQSAMR